MDDLLLNLQVFWVDRALYAVLIIATILIVSSPTILKPILIFSALARSFLLSLKLLHPEDSPARRPSTAVNVFVLSTGEDLPYKKLLNKLISYI